ncbi:MULTISPECIES: Eco57I restriction-modification methylase domain-containing protein [Roseomonadaceae]|uniref:site-specific DNA-methyltransferase (adenine-specific) n=1 Tax=Falsiroseomonas oleicola TaxID=2801474 RepID=A0ABS6H8R9_9PROT|nr:Eco57I restriction-modification methylase domain-containing protein [Roseomonas oleicola]MBU8544776.1 Eco57I restriction-modification methylase domain-containing protein [Roseomonas oleicola]
MIGGGLFSRYYLDEGVRQGGAWGALPDAEVDAFAVTARAALAKVPASGSLREAETETLLIFPILAALGWPHLPQQKGNKRREDVPDALLFLDADAPARVLKMDAGYDRWKQAAVVVENKAWDLPLDRASGKTVRTPASQALRYLRLGDEHTGGVLRWALLTNGRQWRLYFAGAASMSDRFLEVDLPALVAGADTPEGIARLRTFMLFFRRDAFAPDTAGRSFLLAAMEEGREWQERVTADLTRAVFSTVYPELLAALGAADPARKPSDPAWPDTVRQNAVILLYRLLFLLYAEDRDLLPVDHKGYQPRSLARLRQEVAEALDEARPLSDTDAFWWGDLKALFNAVDKGSDAMGLPAYNGGLFDPQEAPMLHAVALPDKPVAAILDGLSRLKGGEEKRRVNYRDLSVQQLGAIYERLLDFDVEVDAAGAVVLTKDSIARKESGSFYTPPSLVRLILDSTIGPHITESRERFKAKAETLNGDRRTVAERITDLRRFDPADALLNLKLADPAMGSGHFLVSVVDRLADAVLLAMEEAAVIAQLDGGVEGYTSPLADRIEVERARIEGAAKTHGWPYRAEHLDDRHLVRRLVLKRAVYGVDQNRLAVELAKLSLWLHSFTVGAPLSFLDHHLRHGDSLFGAWVADTGDQLAKRGSMLLHQAVDNARGAAAGMARIEDLADADLSQVRESKQVFETVEEATAPLRAFLDLWHALLWLPPAGEGIPAGPKRKALVKEAEAARQRTINTWLDGLCGDPVALAAGTEKPKGIPRSAREVAALLDELRAIARRENLLHWQPAFPGVWGAWKGMDAQGGFDAVVGNPPWVRQETIAAKKPVLKARYQTYEGKADLSTFFLEQAQRLVRPGGRVAFVLPNKFFKADYGEPLRAFLAKNTWIESVVDFGHNRDLFPDADVFPCVVVTRRPDPAAEPASDAAVAVVTGDRVPQERLAALVQELRFPMPRLSFTAQGWELEPPPVRQLMERMRAEGTPLREAAGMAPQYGIKTGFNEAFVVETATKDRLVAEDPASASLFRRFLRGGDIERWASPLPDLWMIALRSSSDHPWPWASAPDATKAEAIFKATYPALHRRMAAHREKLIPREDQGRFWWELRPCAYYDAFDRPKIIYQEIQFYPAYALDTGGLYLNNKGFMIASADPFLLAALTSPLLWWFGWRHFPHMKDEALTPAGFKMERLPIARPTKEQAERAAVLTARLAETHRARHAAAVEVADWLRVEWGLAAPPAALASPFALSADAFADALRKVLPKKRKLSVAEVAAVKAAHAGTVAPITARLNEAARLERDLSAVVNAAYGLTPEEEALVWRTAPPRMPITPPASEAAAAE